MNKKTITFLIAILFHNLGFAQQNNIQNNNENGKKTFSQAENNLKNEKDFSLSQRNELDNLLKKNLYPQFYEAIKNTKVGGTKYISYLDSKKDEGYIPLYWLMADYYAQQPNRELDAHIWYYTAIIMTSQDARLCYDQTSKFATEKLTRAFPKSVDIIRKTPQFTEEAMRKVIFFIPNIKKRITPDWVCIFGNEPVREGNRVLLDKDQWDTERQKIFTKFTKNYNK